ncbi:MAG: hypothetical protein ACYC91_07005 [Solirubrobacteraceae bacterium]
MSRLRRTGLTLDDPLAAAPTATNGSVIGAGDVESAATAASGVASTAMPSRSKKTAARRPSSTLGASPVRTAAPGSAMTAQAGEPWRSWTGQTRVASYRLPDELLAELGDTATRLQLPIGLLVTAALAHLLDHPDDAIQRLVDRADDTRIQGRRWARRAAEPA